MPTFWRTKLMNPLLSGDYDTAMQAPTTRQAASTDASGSRSTPEALVPLGSRRAVLIELAARRGDCSSCAKNDTAS